MGVGWRGQLLSLPSRGSFFPLPSLCPATPGPADPGVAPLLPPRVCFLPSTGAGRPLAGTCGVFQAVGQPAALPGSRLCIEHRVESQLAQLKGGPLQQGDLVLDGQVPGGKDGWVPASTRGATGQPPPISRNGAGAGGGSGLQWLSDRLRCLPSQQPGRLLLPAPSL